PVVVLAALLEGFPYGVFIEVIFIFDAVEIITTDIDGQVLAPVIIDPRPDDRAAGRYFFDFIGAGAKRDFKRRAANVALSALRVLGRPPVLGQHGKLAHDLRQFAIALL